MTTLPCLGKGNPVTRANSPKMATLDIMNCVPPKSWKRTGIPTNAQMFGNDTLGDCTSAGIANAARAMASIYGYNVQITDEDVISFYSASTGYSPSVPGSDQGGIEVDVLNYAAKNGYKAGFQTLYPMWGNVNHKSRSEMAICVAKVGPVYLGVQLAEADQNQKLWSTHNEGNNTPGSWGGHCCLLWDYDGLGDDDEISIITWGGIQKATWAWLDSRIDEAHGIVFRQLIPAKDIGGWDAFVEQNKRFI